MAGYEFSPEELKILNKNPYTLKATSKRIMFTLEGKKKMVQCKRLCGESIAEKKRLDKKGISSIIEMHLGGCYTQVKRDSVCIIAQTASIIQVQMSRTCC